MRRAAPGRRTGAGPSPKGARTGAKRSPQQPDPSPGVREGSPLDRESRLGEGARPGYENMEYTPYGELWMEHGPQGLEAVPYRFTGKELDQETGLYYYGARYLNPRTSRWISPDPAQESYLPVAIISVGALQRNQNLPGMGGVFNIANLAAYHYANNNPVRYSDPSGADAGNPGRYDIGSRNRAVVDYVVSLPLYREGYPTWRGIHEQGLAAKPGEQPGVTWCQAAANATLIRGGHDTSSILNAKGIGWTNANDMARNASVAARINRTLAAYGLPISGAREVESPQAAQELANQGLMVLAVASNPRGSGHAGIVVPSDRPYDPAQGPLIAQQGTEDVAGVRSARESFGRLEVHYYILPQDTDR